MIERRQIRDYPRYFAGSDGNVYRRIKDKRSAHYPWKKVGHIGPYGYIIVFLCKTKLVAAHALICEAFHGPKPPHCDQSRHLNGNKTDNRPDNLAWGTYLENAADKAIHGTNGSGEKNGRAKITASHVVKIREMRASGHSWKRISDEFGISPTNVRLIVAGVTWSHI